MINRSQQGANIAWESDGQERRAVGSKIPVDQERKDTRSVDESEYEKSRRMSVVWMRSRLCAHGKQDLVEFLQSKFIRERQRESVGKILPSQTRPAV